MREKGQRRQVKQERRLSRARGETEREQLTLAREDRREENPHRSHTKQQKSVKATLDH